MKKQDIYTGDCKLKEEKHIKIAVRLDDITADMDWDKFNQFKAVLDKYQIKPLIGVVPDNQDQTLAFNQKKTDFFQYIKELEAEGWSIAQHGYQHVYQNHNGGIFPLNRDSEFTGETYQVQREKLQKGKQLLENQGIIPTIYMAPSHSYDKTTIKALVDLGFTTITDGFGKHPYQRQGIAFLPIAFHSKKALLKKSGVTTLVFHTNGMNEAAMEYWDKEFGKQQENLINYHQLLSYPVENRSCFGNVKEYIMAQLKHFLVLYS